MSRSRAGEFCAGSAFYSLFVWVVFPCASCFLSKRCVFPPVSPPNTPPTTPSKKQKNNNNSNDPSDTDQQGWNCLEFNPPADCGCPAGNAFRTAWEFGLAGTGDSIGTGACFARYKAAYPAGLTAAGMRAAANA